MSPLHMRRESYCRGGLKPAHFVSIMPKQITAYEVAAFTNHPAAGSPTGLVLNARGLSDHQMQHIARQLGFSHTAFASETHAADYDVNIRFFTPLREIPSCGHATIAAHYLMKSHSGRSENRLVRQKTASGLQDVEIRYHKGIFFKQNPIQFTDVLHKTNTELCDALGIPNQHVVMASPGANRFLVRLETSKQLISLHPDFAAIKSLCERHDAIGCFVYAAHGEAFNARMFAPAIGINEDIVNGNSSGCLGAYLLRSLPESEIRFRVNQGFAFDRPGTVHVDARWNGEEIETKIGGEAALARTVPIRVM